VEEVSDDAHGSLLPGLRVPRRDCLATAVAEALEVLLLCGLAAPVLPLLLLALLLLLARNRAADDGVLRRPPTRSSGPHTHSVRSPAIRTATSFGSDPALELEPGSR
jgi:hypothetical protein